LPPEGPALERWTRRHIGAVVVAFDSTLASAVALRTGVALAARHGPSNADIIVMGGAAEWSGAVGEDMMAGVPLQSATARIAA
jgi:hypothetical protein